MRAFGVPTRIQSGQFPRFSSQHLVNDDQIPEEGTNYHIVDPSHGKNWVMIWVRVAPDGKCYVYREWPSQNRSIQGVGFAGEWAVGGKKADGEKGPAQDPFGWSLARYKKEILELEGDEIIASRIMDSRFGSSPTPTASGMTTLIDSMADLDIHFEPSVGVRIEEGVTLINDLLDYDDSMPIDPTNTPRLFIHEDCKNMRFALSTWTGKDGRHGACKDWPDALRYFCLAGPIYIDPAQQIIYKGGSY